jgi:hypothetical protein
MSIRSHAGLTVDHVRFVIAVLNIIQMNRRNLILVQNIVTCTPIAGQHLVNECPRKQILDRVHYKVTACWNTSPRLWQRYRFLGNKYRNICFTTATKDCSHSNERHFSMTTAETKKCFTSGRREASLGRKDWAEVEYRIQKRKYQMLESLTSSRSPVREEIGYKPAHRILTRSI